jgi:hypothetical protein
MPITITQEVYEIRSISPVHINPSIMEGEQQRTSIIGPQRGDTIERYAPIWLNVPQITGDPGIPNTMFCTPGTVDASPSASRSYHWYVDGVSAQVGVGPAFAYFDTDATMDSKFLTCTVTATNQVGSASATSDPVFVSLIEPVIVGEHYIFGVTGLPAEDHITVFMDEIAVLTGMWVDDHVTTFSDDIFIVTGTDLMDHIGISHFDTYTGEFMTLVDDVGFANAGAESGAGSWTVTGGALQSVTVTPPTGTSGTKAFRGPSVANSSCTFSQIQDIASSLDDEIDAGLCYSKMMFYAARQGSATYDGTVRGYYECLTDANVVLETRDFFGVYEPQNLIVSGMTNNWTYFSSPPELVPVGTRRVRITFDLPGESTTGLGNICVVDQISLQILQVST